MTPEERRTIFKTAWTNSLKKDLYPTHLNGSNIAINHFLMNVSLSLFPDNNINSDLDMEQYEIHAVQMMRAIKNDLQQTGATIHTFNEQSLDELPDSAYGLPVFVILENPLLLRKLGSKIINYLYLGDDLLMDSFLGSVLHWENWKLNPEWKPRLLFWVELPFDGVKKMHVGDKWFRPYDSADKLIWDDFWSGICL
ncbi:MAG: hypothetical protein HN374_00285 [Cryomorphaceae bacterium]|jgi:hypothetical protein|nr:hypothetical protein [Cryomorphaceae bacterium]